MMDTLAQLQHAFIQATLKGNHSLFLDSIHAKTTELAEYSFSLYQSAIQTRFQQALSSIYPVCCNLLGQNAFNALSLNYQAHYPSPSYDLNRYGETLSEFIALHLNNAPPYLADLARLEWAWHRLYYASCEIHTFPFNKLTEQDYEAFRFVLPHHSTLLQSTYPLLDIWNNPHHPFIATQTPYYFFIWQTQCDLNIQTLNVEQWQILKWIEEGISFHTIAQSVEQQQLDISLPTQLPEWIQQHIIIDIEKVHPDTVTISPVNVTVKLKAIL